jgi:endonuclease/exonuclease/phosphatase family metal-dependent hydrolase
MKRLLLVVLAACAGPLADDVTDDDGAFDIGKADGACLSSAESDDARGLLAYANDPAVGAGELRALGIFARPAQLIVEARPFVDLAALDAVPNVGPFACRVLRRQACDVRGLCERVLPVWTWNVEHFPLSDRAIDHVAAALDDAELVGFQEVDSLDAFDQLLVSLPGWAGLPGAHGFGTQVAVAYRTDRLALVATEDLFVGDRVRFPRPVLAATFDVIGRVGRARFTLLVVHLKAQIDAESQRRRRDAVIVLDDWIQRRRAAGELVIALGDWNDDIDDPPASNVFMPILSRPDVYAPITLTIAERGGFSYIPFRRLIDHIVLTREAAQRLEITEVDVLALDAVIPRYTTTVSDHRPVAAHLIPILPR